MNFIDNFSDALRSGISQSHRRLDEMLNVERLLSSDFCPEDYLFMAKKVFPKLLFLEKVYFDLSSDYLNKYSLPDRFHRNAYQHLKKECHHLNIEMDFTSKLNTSDDLFFIALSYVLEGSSSGARALVSKWSALSLTNFLENRDYYLYLSSFPRSRLKEIKMHFDSLNLNHEKRLKVISHTQDIFTYIME